MYFLFEPFFEVSLDTKVTKFAKNPGNIFKCRSADEGCQANLVEINRVTLSVMLANARNLSSFSKQKPRPFFTSCDRNYYQVIQIII